MQDVYDIPSANLLGHTEAVLGDNLNLPCSFLIQYNTVSLLPNRNETALVLRTILLLYMATAGTGRGQEHWCLGEERHTPVQMMPRCMILSVRLCVPASVSTILFTALIVNACTLPGACGEMYSGMAGSIIFCSAMYCAHNECQWHIYSTHIM